jgi:hypothetical protein
MAESSVVSQEHCTGSRKPREIPVGPDSSALRRKPNGYLDLRCRAMVLGHHRILLDRLQDHRLPRLLSGFLMILGIDVDIPVRLPITPSQAMASFQSTPECAARTCATLVRRDSSRNRGTVARQPRGI